MYALAVGYNDNDKEVNYVDAMNGILTLTAVLTELAPLLLWLCAAKVRWDNLQVLYRVGFGLVQQTCKVVAKRCACLTGSTDMMSEWQGSNPESNL